MSEINDIALSLSGGGVRAMVFHAGVLSYLSEKELLENISNISTVSGGSLLIGMILKENNYVWPTSQEYTNKVFKRVKCQLCSKSLQNTLIWELFKPKNWKYCLSRANILAGSIQKLWEINVNLNDIPETPVWSINGTTAENGKRFRFKKNSFGDYFIGYSASSNIKLSQAMSVSAAFPGLIGPFKLKMKNFNWTKREKWNAPKESEKIVQPSYRTISIYDGGVYDNLGTEPFFDFGKKKLKLENSDTFLLVSDAGKPLGKTFKLGAFNPLRFKRLLDISMDQSRALRIRALMAYFTENKNSGGGIFIDESPQNILNLSNTESWQNEKEVIIAKQYPTDLQRISTKDFDVIARHGYEVAKAIGIIRGF